MCCDTFQLEIAGGMLLRRSILEGVIMKKLFVAGAAAVLMTTSVVMAQSAASNGGIWDGRDHQPTRAQTAQKEKAVGIAPTKSERTSERDTVGQIDHRLPDGSPDSPMIGTSSTDEMKR